jgi:hypothetical protein
MSSFRTSSPSGKLLPVNPYVIRSPAERRELQTYVGMASFAGSGPAGALCGGCGHWLGEPGKNGAAPCAQFRRLTGRGGPRVPPHASACKYFKAKEPRR